MTVLSLAAANDALRPSSGQLADQLDELLGPGSHGVGGDRAARAPAHSQGSGGPDSRAIPSCRAASCQGLRRGGGEAGGGAVERMKCSSAATIAAACTGEAPEATIVSFGRRFTVAPRVSCATGAVDPSPRS